LLRSNHAIVILVFLMSVFRQKTATAVEVEHSRMKALLSAYLEDIDDVEADKLARQPEAYLNEWVSAGYLHRKAPLGAEEPLYSLSSEADRAIRFAESLEPKEFVGTESRLRTIVNLLRDLDENTDPDINRRLDKLSAQREALADQMAEIHAAGKVEVYSETQVMERLAQAEEAGRELVAAFSRVRELFHEAVRTIAAKQAEAGVTRGAILEHAIQQDDYLKSTPEGQSFYIFWQFLLSSRGDNEITRLAEKLYDRSGLPAGQRERRLLMTLPHTLLEEGRNVVDVNGRMSRQLRALLDTEAVQRRHALLALLTDIKHLATKTADLQAPDEFMDLPSSEGLVSPMSRPNWHFVADSRTGESMEVAGAQQLTTELAAALFRATGFSETQLLENIRATLRAKGGSAGVFLEEVLASWPPGRGILDLLGYLYIAHQHSIHVTEIPGTPFSFTLTERGNEVGYLLPTILYHPDL
jgi:hypothetical protein